MQEHVDLQLIQDACNHSTRGANACKFAGLCRHQYRHVIKGAIMRSTRYFFTLQVSELDRQQFAPNEQMSTPVHVVQRSDMSGPDSDPVANCCGGNSQSSAVIRRLEVVTSSPCSCRRIGCIHQGTACASRCMHTRCHCLLRGVAACP